MSTIESGNWCFRDPGDDIPEGSVIVGGNFSQLAPDTPIMPDKALTILGGNWVNVRRDPAWTVEGGNWTQVSRCSHLHPEWIDHGLSECIEECSHVIATEVIGGITFYEYADVRL